MIWLEGVSYLRAGSPALQDVTLGVSFGELVVVQGLTGSGKSSLLAVAAGARAPDSGAVWIAEHNIVGLQASSLPYVRRNVGYLPPEPLLIQDETALDEVLQYIHLNPVRISGLGLSKGWRSGAGRRGGGK